MKRSIRGLTYDTDTATLIAQWSPPGVTRSDFRWEETGLYKTPRGRFFLAGLGGAMSRWARPAGQNERGPGSGIHPLEAEEALAWAEAHDVDPDVIAEHFDVEEG